MVLIFASINDPSTHGLIDSLLYYEKEFLYINEYNPVDYIFYDLNNNFFELNSKQGKITSVEVEYVILRNKNLFLSDELLNIREKDYREYHKKEYQKLNEHFFKLIYEHFLCFGDFIYINKLEALKTAQKIGLKIPSTIITTKWSSLLPDNLITKPINEIFSIFKNGYHLKGYTNIIRKKEIHKSNNFFPTLFQNEIKKEFEIRTFCFHNNFYSLAIFSQNNAKTSVDYRQYDYRMPNRCSLYHLPLDIKKKISKLFRALKLKTGSVDLIFTNNEYYFLEVNPYGQFSNISDETGLMIEKKIIEYYEKKSKIFVS